MSDDKLQVVRNVHIPARDTHFQAALAMGPIVNGHGTYQLSKLVKSLELVKNKDMALDIGAHVGLWSMILARHFKTVHAFEPLPIHIDCFIKNTKFLHNVTLHKIALGNADGIVGMLAAEDNSGNTRVAPNTIFSSAAAIHRLDHIAESLKIVKVDYIKIDVEGYELQVVRGAEKLIKDSKPVMVVEQKSGNAERYEGDRTGLVIELLHSWGAETVWVRSGDYCLRWR